jgi:endonuclease/exonuclease/phosphatase family metal-dependent hydrolase
MDADLERRFGPGWLVMLATAMAVFVAFSLARCGGDEDPIDIIEPPGTATPITPQTVVAEPTPNPTEFRIAYINILSPRTLDSANTVPSETFEERMALIVKELKEFRPDVVAFSEVSDTQEHGKAAEILWKELKLEKFYVRSKPWVPGQTKEQEEASIKLFGFEEGTLILFNANRFPNPGGERRWLNPRTNDYEAPAAIWMRFKGPDSIGEIDVFVTQLTGIDSRARSQQAADFASYIESKRGEGPVIVLGDLGDPPDSATVKVFGDMGLEDAFTGIPELTCCREAVIGEQPAAAVRTDYMLVEGWTPSVVDVFADQPGTRADGTLLYASDHNGISAVFPIP